MIQLQMHSLINYMPLAYIKKETTKINEGKKYIKK